MPDDRADTFQPEWASVTHVANVAWPAPGECFRMVYSGFNGYPTRCPVTPEWSGTFVKPKGERWPVEACDEHMGDLHRPTSADRQHCLPLLG